MTSDRDNPRDNTVQFPTSRTTPARTRGGFVELGITPLATLLGLQEWQLNGHWCSRCRGIWYGYTLEAQCPRCGNRHG